ncbi:MAG: hypothetical protein R3F44_13670 [Candidatus Competibacteraceae bacterium]
MPEPKPSEVYQLRVWLQGVSPMVWRRLLVRSDSTIADLHYTLQIGGVSPNPRKFREGVFHRFLAKTFPITSQNGKVSNVHHD